MLIFPDYTPDVIRQRHEFSEVLGDLRELKVEHSLLFPAKLRIKHKGEAMSFLNTDLKNIS